MKKKIAGFLAVCTLMFILVPSAIRAADQPTGLLDGVTMSLGTSIHNPLAYTTNVTDNDPSTTISFPTVASSPIIKDTIYYEFSSPVTINAYKMYITNYDDGPVFLAYFNSSGDLVSRIPLSPNAGDNKIFYLPNPISDVKTVTFYHSNTSTYQVAELNVYNITTDPTPTSTPEVSTTPEPTISPEPTIEPTPTVEPTPSPTPEHPTGNRAILVVTMNTGLEKEFDLSMDEVNSFITWYENKQAGTGKASYAIDKHDNNKGPFTNRKDYVIFDKILTFSVDEYSAK
ncbi:procyclic acidic repetitive family protein [Paenibacillus sonchi]|uniref:procyclic acidic repetitive family protein n=1 Tax=Paenibacillus sonchi TaxID=373687 RepID=UPI001F415F57|nr:procyclic acidic repetitive family protein [Paenibacillus sonchi]